MMDMKTLKKDPWHANRFKSEMDGIRKKTRKSTSENLRMIPGRIPRKVKKALKNEMYALAFLRNAFTVVLDSMDDR